MALFRDIFVLKEFVGGSVSPSMEMDSINPHISLTANRHLFSFLSEEVWMDLLIKYESNSTDTAFLALLPHVQRPLALLSVFEYAKVGGIQFGESGITRTETQDVKSAYKYQENEFKTTHLYGGYDMLETLLKFLVKNKGDYPDWAISDEAETMQSSLMNYSSDFRKAYGNHINRYTFEILRPIIDDLEAVAIAPCIGEDLIEELKASILSTKQKKLLAIIRKALANFAIEEGQKRLWVRIQGNEVVQSEILEPQGYQKTTAPGNMPMTYSDRHHADWGNRHMLRIKNYLEANIDDFPTYSAFVDETTTATETEDNDTPPPDYSGKILQF